MSDNYASPLLNSNNPPNYSYSNNHVINVINPIHLETDKSYCCCDKTVIACFSLIVFIACVIILIIIHYS
jgi:hypothetical protein